MMRAVLTLLCSLCLIGCVHIDPGSRPMGSIMSQSETPQPGDWCRVTTQESGDKYHRQGSRITGRVDAVDERGIHLSDVVKESYEMSATPVVSAIPYIGRRFKNTGVGRENSETYLVARTEISMVEMITEEEARQKSTPVAKSPPNIAQQLVAAVPGRR